MRTCSILLVLYAFSCTAAIGGEQPAGKYTDAPGGASVFGPRWFIHCEVKGAVSMGLPRGEDRTKIYTLKCTCLRDGDRFDAQTVRYDGDAPIRGWRSILDGWYVSYQMPPRGQTVPSGYYATQGDRFVGAALPTGLGTFEGYLAGDYLNITEIKQLSTNVALAQDSVEGHRCDVVSIDSADYGHYQLWYDAAFDHLPRKVEVKKTARHYAGQMRLGQWTPRTPLGSPGPTPIIEMVYSMDQAKFDRAQDHWFPLSCRITRVLRYADGNSETTLMQWRRTGLDLNPNPMPDGAFKPELRQGAHLINLAEAHLPFQWKDNRAVPLVDEDLVTQMNRTAESLRDQLRTNAWRAP